jgi:hypothetical protein
MIGSVLIACADENTVVIDHYQGNPHPFRKLVQENQSERRW